MLDSTDARLVGALLVAGFFVFLTGAARWKLDYEGSGLKSLEAIAAAPGRWRWIHTWMIAGVFVTLLGLGGLTHLMIEADGRFFSSFGFLVFALGVLPWLVGVAWRLTVLTWMATEADTSKVVPADFGAWGAWFGILHTIHLISAYIAWIALGVALLDSGLVPRGVAWAGIGLGAVGSVGYVGFKGGPFAPPILAHLYTLIVGIALLVEWR